MTMTGQELRAALAAAAAGVLPSDWTTYAFPPDVVAFPAAVVVARSPYLAPARYCAGIYQVAVTLLLARAVGPPAGDILDTWTEPVRRAIAAIGGIVWEGTDMGPMIAPGGVEAYGSTINLQAFA